MTQDQRNLLMAAHKNLLLEAHRMVELHQAGKETGEAELNLNRAAEQYVHVVDSIDPNLWNPPPCDGNIIKAEFSRSTE